ncbi:protein kinase RIO1 NDAI_0B05650 [Naumovozyma dairenensis CBS 421]|uniref:Serine/threonine-protein kinase RIO1 n=1 Tax=Naumovozyma dairenensis (strain ATCC 10597 / BCRC 20456 / CBS 421 / NBRC 0211 / NRRL Y-12639) TaxID=1071378 RepID=G0W737_NAUDC|nr:hypothetical protein NDAI_0B05650 [Naumovozyma dairenensis CBS 421]CCD23598.1 hypothetical protein NDAI_0B05650 [Naumovozyma dairenensis CBS 421]
MSFTKGKTNKDKANRATVENVLDPRTMKFLKALTSRGVISDFNGCLSTGKEANVYHAFAGDSKLHSDDTDEPHDDNNIDEEALKEKLETQINPEETRLQKDKKEYAVKIFKTSILVFKDRERYVDGEFRFRNSRSQHNPRKMIKIWAEKEFRNLRRIYQSNVIPVPKPIEVKNNVLIMEFLNRGDGFASPRLRDYPYKDREEVIHYYHIAIAYMRLMYQVCRLVHADLSEYNILIHNNLMYIIDVSQSVEPEHPMSLDFLRMDIKNINMYFDRMGIDIFPERVIFQFIISETLDKFTGNYNDYNDLRDYVAKTLPIKKTAQDEAEDEIFRSLYLVRNLEGLEERDFDRYTDGKFDLLKSLIAHDNEKNFSAAEQFEIQDDDEEIVLSDNNDEEDTSADSDESDSDDEGYESEEKVLKGKKHEDKDEKKQRKQDAKDAKREKRKTKVKKHIKKKLVKKTKSKK